MNITAQIVIGIVAFIHIYILWLEMFAWTTRAPKVFRGFPKDLFPRTVALAANQGLYNGFLAAGLIWSLIISDIGWSANVAYFFLGCIMIAGLYGAATAQKTILFVQTIPAAIGVFCVYYGL